MHGALAFYANAREHAMLMIALACYANASHASQEEFDLEDDAAPETDNEELSADRDVSLQT